MRSCAAARNPAGSRCSRSACRERLSLAPDIPTVHEAGFPSLNTETTAGFYGPRGMAQDLRERIGKDVVAVVADPEITKRLVATGQTVRTGGPAELAQTLQGAGRADGDGGEDARAQGREVVEIFRDSDMRHRRVRLIRRSADTIW